LSTNLLYKQTTYTDTISTSFASFSRNLSITADSVYCKTSPQNRKKLDDHF